MMNRQILGNSLEQLAVQRQTNKQNQQDGRLNHSEHLCAILTIAKIMKRKYSRDFIKRLTFCFIQMLKNQSQNNKKNTLIHQKSSYWAQFINKKHFNQEEKQWVQFLNMCAQMIQRKFKSYITRRRHLQAKKKADKIKDLLLSFYKRWKIQRIYNCEKIVNIRAKIRQIQKQIDTQQQTYPDRDIKKLKSLYKYLQINLKIFRDTYSILLQTGMWTLQSKVLPSRRVLQKFNKTPKIQMKQNQKQTANNRKYLKQNIDQNSSNEFIPSNNQNTSNTEERPIKATGQYIINQIYSQSNNQSTNETVINQSNSEQAQKAQRTGTIMAKKRIKYDPVKAIQQEKKRKKELNKKLEKTNQNDQIRSDEICNQKNIVDNLVKKNESQKQIKSINKTKKQLAKTFKQDNIDGKDDKNKKSFKKNSVRVDCWANKKQVEPEWVKQYKTKLLQSNEACIQNNKCVRLQNQNVSHKEDTNVLAQKAVINESTFMTNSKNETQFNSIVSIKLNCNQKQERQKQMYEQVSNSFNGKSEDRKLKQEQRVMNKKIIGKKKQVHRPIEQLQQTYNKHYGQRFRNLMPKLSLLSISRSQQKNQNIPIILDFNKQFNKWFQNLYGSTHYWKVANQYDRIFKSFSS